MPINAEGGGGDVVRKGGDACSFTRIPASTFGGLPLCAFGNLPAVYMTFAHGVVHLSKSHGAYSLPHHAVLVDGHPILFQEVVYVRPQTLLSPLPKQERRAAPGLQVSLDRFELRAVQACVTMEDTENRAYYCSD